AMTKPGGPGGNNTGMDCARLGPVQASQSKREAAPAAHLRAARSPRGKELVMTSFQACADELGGALIKRLSESITRLGQATAISKWMCLDQRRTLQVHLEWVVPLAPAMTPPWHVSRDPIPGGNIPDRDCRRRSPADPFAPFPAPKSRRRTCLAFRCAPGRRAARRRGGARCSPARCPAGWRSR